MNVASALLALLGATRLAPSLQAQEPPNQEPPAQDSRPATPKAPDRELLALRILREALGKVPGQSSLLGYPPQHEAGPRFPECGNGLWINPEFANDRIEALFRAYYLEPARRVLVIGDHLHARLDGYDPVRRVGWKLLSPVMSDLDDEAELERLTGTATILVAWVPARGTDCVPQLLAAIEWLNTHTNGIDVPTDALAWRRLQSAPLPLPPGAAGVQGPDERGIVRFRLEAASAWSIHSRLLVWHERRGPFPRGNDVLATPATALQAPQSTAGSPTIVQLELRVDQAGPLVGKLRQATTVPGVSDATRGARATFVMPSTFDAAAPFTIDLQMAPGDYEMRPWLHVGLPVR